MLNLNNKQFKALHNSDNGEVSSETIFHYHQEGETIWAEYSGGAILKGHLLGKMNANQSLEFVYHHINLEGQVLTGKCFTIISNADDKKLVLKETWQWTCGDFSKGTSLLKEI